MSSFPRKITVYTARTVLDASGLRVSPGAVAFEGNRVLAAGEPEKVRAALGGRDAQEVRRDECLILPGLVNAHTHLDLSSLGYQPFTESFTDWIRQVIRRRPKGSKAIGDSVKKGMELCRAAGSLTVGDICGSADAWRALAEGPLRGVGFEERFGLADPPDFPWRVESSHAVAGPLAAGLQPHAPYSSGPALYREAASVAMKYAAPLCTHLAETPEEARFTAEAAGPFADLLRELGRWADDLQEHYGQGLSPVAWLDAVLEEWQPPMLLAHAQYLDEADRAILLRRRWHVAYCPRASEYFGHRDHPYRDLMQAGINVALGTDSAVCHGDQSILEEMRLLHRRDGVDGDTLLKMATCNGMEALGLDPAQALFAPARQPGAIAIGYDVRPGRSALNCVLGAATCPRVEVLEMPAGTA